MTWSAPTWSGRELHDRVRFELLPSGGLRLSLDATERQFVMLDIQRAICGDPKGRWWSWRDIFDCYGFALPSTNRERTAVVWAEQAEMDNGPVVDGLWYLPMMSALDPLELLLKIGEITLPVAQGVHLEDCPEEEQCLAKTNWAREKECVCGGAGKVALLPPIDNPNQLSLLDWQPSARQRWRAWHRATRPPVRGVLS